MEGSFTLLTLIYPQKQLLIPRRLLRVVLGSFLLWTIAGGVNAAVNSATLMLYISCGAHFVLWLVLVPLAYRDPYLFFTIRRKFIRRNTAGGLFSWRLTVGRELVFY